MISVVNEWKGDGHIYSVAVSPDGSRIGAACTDNVVIVDANSAETVLGPLQGHTDWARSVAFSPDGRTLVSASADETVRLWDTETGKLTTEPLRGHTDIIWSVTYAGDSHLIISGSLDSTIRLWDTRTGQPAGQHIDAGSGVWAIAVSRDGRKVAGGTFNNRILTFDTTTRAKLFQSTGHGTPTVSVAFSPDGHRIASGSYDKTIRLWDGSMGHEIGSPLRGHTHNVRSVSFSPDGRYLASASDDKTIRIWDPKTGESQCDPLGGHTGIIRSIAFTPDGSQLISGSDDNSVKIWDIQDLLTPVLVDPLGSLEHPELEIEIRSTTSSNDIVSCLGARGCFDMTNTLDWSTCTDIPVFSGGFGDIYKCTLKGSTEVAIKTMRVYASESENSQKALKWAAREIYTWSKFRHQNVQPLLGLVVFRDCIGMVAAWEVNGNLPQYLGRHPEVDRYLMVANGLAYLHASGVVHGDLKGANVLVSNDGCAQLADFGSAVLDQYTLQFSQTSTKTHLTIRWAAPELLNGGKYSQQSDVYALGMTILETVTGEVPWIGKTDMGILSAVLLGKATPERPLAHIHIGSARGDTLWSLLKSCWMYEPDERPSADNVYKTLSGVMQE